MCGWSAGKIRRYLKMIPKSFVFTHLHITYAESIVYAHFPANSLILIMGKGGGGYPHEAAAGSCFTFAPLITSHSMIATSPSMAGKVIFEIRSLYCGANKSVKLVAT